MFIMRRVCNNFSTTGNNIDFPDQLEYHCNAFMLQYQLNSTFRNVSIDDPRNYRVLYEVIAQTMKVQPFYSRHDTLIQCRFNIKPSSATLPQE